MVYSYAWKLKNVGLTRNTVVKVNQIIFNVQFAFFNMGNVLIGYLVFEFRPIMLCHNSQPLR